MESTQSLPQPQVAGDVPMAPPTHKRYIVMAFLCVLAFLTYFDRICIMRAQKDIQHDLNINDYQMGLILGAFWLAYALFEIPGGWMGDRYGSRVTLTRIVVAWSLFTILSGSATGFASLFLYRFLFGVGEAGAFPNMARVQSNWLPVLTRARFGGLLWLLARWGGAFSPIIFGEMLRFFDDASFRNFMRALHLPGDIQAWRMAFWTAGLIGVGWCLAFYFWFRDDPAQVPSVNAAELRLIKRDDANASHASQEGHSMPGHIWAALLLSPSLWAMGVLYIFYSFAWSFFVSWMPRFFSEVHNVDFASSELMSGMPLFFGGISCLAGGTLSDWLVRRTGRKWLGRALFPIGGYALAALCMFGVQFTKPDEFADQASRERSLFLCQVLLCLAATAADFGQGANWATVVDIGGRYAGTALGFVNMVGCAGNYLQPVIGAVIFRHYGWNTLMAVYAAFLLAAAAFWVVINPNRTFYSDGERER